MADEITRRYGTLPTRAPSNARSTRSSIWRRRSAAGTASQAPKSASSASTTSASTPASEAPASCRASSSSRTTSGTPPTPSRCAATAAAIGPRPSTTTRSGAPRPLRPERTAPIATRIQSLISLVVWLPLRRRMDHLPRRTADDEPASPDGATPDGDDVPARWEELLRAVFGDDAEAALRELDQRGIDPQAMASAAGLPDDPVVLRQILDQIKHLLESHSDEPVNSEIAHDVARQVAVAEGDPSIGEHARRQVIDAFSVAELWLDAATDLPPAGAPVRAWSRSEWVESTLPTWRSLAEPVAISVSDGLRSEEHTSELQ